MTTQRTIETPHGPAEVTVDRPGGAVGTLVLTHGANGATGTADLLALARAVPEQGWAYALVRQPFAVAGRRMPPRPPAQDEAWLAIIAGLTSGRSRLPGPLVVGGRSNGARVACRTAVGSGADGVLALAFPLHPPGRPDTLRADELALPYAAGLPVRVLQGVTDPFGGPEEVRAHCARPESVHAMKGGHGFSRNPVDVVAGALGFLDELVGPR